MSANFVGMVFAAIGVVTAFFLFPRKVYGADTIWGFMLWLLALPLLFFIYDPLWIFAIMAVLLLCLAPMTPARRAAFFILAVPCLPFYLEAEFPFPGINQLLVLTHYKVTAFILLAPLLLIPLRGRARSGGWTAADICVISYVLFSSFASAGESLTGTMRLLTDQFLLIALPYFALARVLAQVEDVEECFRALVTASIMLACVAVIATYKQWDFYRFMEPPSVAAVAEVRGGFLRIAATATTHSLAFHLVVGLLALEYFKRRKAIHWLHLYLLRAILLAGVLSTDSRGALAALVVGSGIYLVLSTRSAELRWGLFAIFGAAVFGGALVMVSADPGNVDPYGTFDYRQKLLTTSLEYIGDNLLFGDPKFLASGRFDHLVQGQGIVDVTNLYLQVALQYGLIGLTLFLIPFLGSFYRLAFSASAWADGEPSKLAAANDIRSILAGALVAWLILVMTTSDVGLTLYLGIVLLAMGQAATRARVARHSVSHPAVSVG